MCMNDVMHLFFLCLRRKEWDVKVSCIKNRRCFLGTTIKNAFTVVECEMFIHNTGIPDGFIWKKIIGYIYVIKIGLLPFSNN